MSEVRFVFLQAEKEDTAALAELLGSLDQRNFTFVLPPKNVELLSKGEVKELLAGLVKED